MVNRYRGTCSYCGGKVAARAGTCFKTAGGWAVAHLACAAKKEPAVINCYSPVTGNSWSMNRNGYCEDAPCCGCCTF